MAMSLLTPESVEVKESLDILKQLSQIEHVLHDAMIANDRELYFDTLRRRSIAQAQFHEIIEVTGGVVITVLGGIAAAGKFPECVALMLPAVQRFEGSGIIVTPSWVLTAAHVGSAIRVFVGDDVTYSQIGVNTYTVKNSVSIGFGLSLLNVYTPIAAAVPGLFGPSCNPPTDGVLVGFGFNEGSGGAGLKRFGNVKLTTILADAIFTTPNPQDVCKGDSGGPLIAKCNGNDAIVGVTQDRFGATCGTGGAFTRITDSVIKAIKDVTGNVSTI